MRYDELSPLTSSTKGSSTDRSSTEGFTLLELLISLTLSALLLTVLSTGIHSAVQDWSHQDKKLDHQVDAALGFLQLEKALRSA